LPVRKVVDGLRLDIQRKQLRAAHEAGRKHVAELFDYRQVARRFLKIVSDRLGIQYLAY